MTSSNPLISIVIPTFRRPDLVEPLLTALCMQTHEIRGGKDQIEILLVDNCPDRSAADAFQAFQAEVTAAAGPVRYLSEPRKGVANARNHGVMHARGKYVVFIDDDELPAPGWLEAFVTLSYAGAEAAFGRIEPDFAAPPPSDTAAAVDTIFSRRFPSASGVDITAMRAWLGSGNSLFDRKLCLQGEMPFDTRFNGGGEDVHLLRSLAAQGVRFTWCPEALVYEHVPVDRTKYEYVAQRKYHDGQLRCVVEAEAKDRLSAAKVALWMVIGIVQVGLHGGAAMLLRPLNLPQSRTHALKAWGGWGKIMWTRHSSRRRRVCSA